MNRHQYITSRHSKFWPEVGDVFILKGGKIIITSQSDVNIRYSTLYYPSGRNLITGAYLSIEDMRQCKFLGAVGGKSFKDKSSAYVGKASHQTYEQGVFIKFLLKSKDGDRYVDVNEFFDKYESYEVDSLVGV